jgi:DNA-binding beta-propeller fold protein YncE
MYVSMERENQLQVFGLKNGQLSSTPLFVKTTLEDPSNVRPGQVVGPIHVSRDGQFVYLANRSDGTVEFEGKKVYVGGENSVAVFSINQQTGEPNLIQTIPTQSYHCRTFTIHPDGKSLITASIAPMLVHEGDKIERVSAALTEFRIADDGKLTFVRKYDIETPAGPMFWVGLIALDNRWSTNAA